MPSTPKKPLGESSSIQKPYPSTSPNKVNTEQSSRGKGSAWTGQELLALFEFAMNREGRDWGQAVEGETANQARQTWAKSVLPLLQKTLLERGNA